MKKIILLALSLLCSVSAIAQIPGLRHGRLSNGLTYYIYGSKDYNNEANFYLIQNVGAIVEEDDQFGLAHFLEHMAFDASKHYPDGIMKFLRDNSIYSFNANTGLDETRYFLYNIPTSNDKIINHAFTILRDWCDGISITSKDVEKERNIIIEEWRQRNDVNKRLSDHIAKVIYPGSKYAERNVIGSVDVLRTFKPQDLKRFYHTWYRPELQCVIIIGDVDAEAYEQKVKEVFGSIKMPADVPERTIYPIEDNLTPLYTQFTDPENISNSFGLYQRIHTPNDAPSSELEKDHIYAMVFNQLISQRINQLRNSGKEEFIAHTVSYSPLIRHQSQNAWDMVPYKGREKEALQQMLNLRETIRRDGFNDEEFTAVQEGIYTGLAKVLESEKLGTPDNFMDIFKQNYLYGNEILPLRDQLQNNAETVIEMTVEDLNNWVRSWMDDKNLAFITYAKKAGDVPISREQFVKALAKAKSAPSMDFSYPQAIDTLIDYPITEGKIVSESDITELGAKEWKLSNGSRVLYRHIPEMKNQIFFVGSAMGGQSSIAAEDLPSYKAMQDLILQSGIYKYSRNQLGVWLIGNEFNLDINLTDYTDNIGGLSSPKDFENMLAYVHLIISKQNFKPEVFRKYKQKQLYLLENTSTSPLSMVQDSIQELLYPVTPLNPREDHQFFDRMNLEDVIRLYDEKFGNAADFTFCIAGDITEDKAKKLTNKYIASLKGIPGTQPRTYKVQDTTSTAPEIIKEFKVDTEGDIGQVEISYINDVKLSEREEKVLQIMESLLQERMFSELREKEAATYGVGVRASYKKSPISRTTLNLRFETERSKVEMLKQKTYDILAEVLNGTFTEDDFNRARLPLAMNERAQEKMDEYAEENPMMWIALLNVYMETGEIPNPDDAKADTAKFEDIKPQEISGLASKIINGAKKREIIVKAIPPEEREWKH